MKHDIALHSSLKRNLIVRDQLPKACLRFESTEVSTCKKKEKTTDIKYQIIMIAR